MQSGSSKRTRDTAFNIDTDFNHCRVAVQREREIQHSTLTQNFDDFEARGLHNVMTLLFWFAYGKRQTLHIRNLNWTTLNFHQMKYALKVNNLLKVIIRCEIINYKGLGDNYVMICMATCFRSYYKNTFYISTICTMFVRKICIVTHPFVIETWNYYE